MVKIYLIIIIIFVLFIIFHNCQHGVILNALLKCCSLHFAHDFLIEIEVEFWNRSRYSILVQIPNSVVRTCELLILLFDEFKELKLTQTATSSVLTTTFSGTSKFLVLSRHWDSFNDCTASWYVIADAL